VEKLHETEAEKKSFVGVSMKKAARWIEEENGNVYAFEEGKTS